MEIEDWNEYGELKQHVTIVPEGGTPARSAGPTPLGTPSKPPVSQENKKPEPAIAESSKPSEASKDTEESKIPVGGVATSFTLAMRQAGQEAAQKAKETKKAVQTFDSTGTGEVELEEPVKKDQGQSAGIPPPIKVGPSSSKNETTTLLQSPTSTAWRNTGNTITSVLGEPPIERVELLQSPKSTTWRPGDHPPPVTMHRGSEVSLASAEEIRQVEETLAIAEEDEDAVED